ncbi:hypothetical protein BLNAU_2509 [Blattamonas nauphoetae]|uniref:ABC transmembrane type-1 domain-containing protein n=1 Tax=Blattamonas nauphoetae TaxID=2049346 RepID=A0ABQ9YGA7_9EUKA|nr:hypothetical protein BLNAU_2509 [Blattamonas nauphoetae]
MLLLINQPLRPTTALSLTSTESIRSVRSFRTFSPTAAISLIDQTFLSLSHAYALLFHQISAFQDAGFALILPLTILALQTITRAVIERTIGTGIAVRKSDLDGSLEWKFVLNRFSALESSVQAIQLQACNS